MECWVIIKIVCLKFKPNQVTCASSVVIPVAPLLADAVETTVLEDAGVWPRCLNSGFYYIDCWWRSAASFLYNCPELTRISHHCSPHSDWRLQRAGNSATWFKQQPTLPQVDQVNMVMLCPSFALLNPWKNSSIHQMNPISPKCYV